MQHINYDRKGQRVASAKRLSGFTMCKAQLVIIGCAIVAVSMILARMY